jgi:hypothetical protein
MIKEFRYERKDWLSMKDTYVPKDTTSLFCTEINWERKREKITSLHSQDTRPSQGTVNCARHSTD